MFSRVEERDGNVVVVRFEPASVDPQCTSLREFGEQGHLVEDIHRIEKVRTKKFVFDFEDIESPNGWLMSDVSRMLEIIELLSRQRQVPAFGMNSACVVQLSARYREQVILCRDLDDAVEKAMTLEVA